jgi:hypothetical protein
MVTIRLYRLYRSYGFTKMISLTRALQMIQGSTSGSHRAATTKKVDL